MLIRCKVAEKLDSRRYIILLILARGVDRWRCFSVVVVGNENPELLGDKRQYPFELGMGLRVVVKDGHPKLIPHEPSTLETFMEETLGGNSLRGREGAAPSKIRQKDLNVCPLLVCIDHDVFGDPSLQFGSSSDEGLDGDGW